MNNQPVRVNQTHNILSIKLSEDGKRTVNAAFPQSAVQHVDENYDAQSNNANPWYAFKEQCIAYCRYNRLPIDFSALKGKTPSQMLMGVHRQTLSPGSSVSSPSSLRSLNQQEGKSNPYPTRDSGLTSQECMHELNTFTQILLDIQTFDPHQKMFGIGSTVEYLKRVIDNWTKQYLFAIEREKKSNESL